MTSLRALLATTESKWGDTSLTTKARLGPGFSSPHFGSKAESEQERLSFQLIYLLLEALGLYLLSSLYVHPRWNTLVGGWLPRLGKDFLCEVRLPQKSPAWPKAFVSRSHLPRLSVPGSYTLPQDIHCSHSH